MNKEEVLNKILEDVFVCKDQTYALYFREGDESFITGYGEFPAPIEECNYRLASVTKQFIASGIIFLVQMGKLSFDTSLYDIYNELPEYTKNIKIMNLLNHTSGLYDYEDMPHKEDDPQVKDRDVLEWLKTTKETYFEVGSKYQYSNTAYVILGLIIEDVSGMKLGDFMEKGVFDKSGLIDTKVNYQGETVINNRMYGQVLVDGKLVCKDQYWCSATIGDGGIYSNLRDLILWEHSLRHAIEYWGWKDLMFKPNIINGVNTEYGMGMRIIERNGKTIYYHCGSTIGTNTIILFSYDLDIDCICLTNVDNTDCAKIKENIVKYYC